MVVVVTLVDVVVEFELEDGDELPQAARPRATATDANPTRDRVVRLVPSGPDSRDMSFIRGPLSNIFDLPQDYVRRSRSVQWISDLQRPPAEGFTLFPCPKRRLAERQSERRSRTW